MDIKTLFLKEDKNVLDIIIRNKGAIYGGYIRDLINGTKPNDIDIIISDLYYDDFVREMIENGYVSSRNYNNNTIVYKKAGNRDIDVSVVDDNPEETILRPVSIPYFDVNLLEYVNEKLIDWTNPDNDISSIIKHIKDKETVQLQSDDKVGLDRIEKIKKKGYTIIDKIYEDRLDYNFEDNRLIFNFRDKIESKTISIDKMLYQKFYL
jgi:hypothetical protein